MEKVILKEYYKNRVGINIEELQALKEQINNFHINKSDRSQMRAWSLKFTICKFCMTVFI